jgi:AcrR family transcriptional regulator
MTQSQSRAALLEAALELFAARGYEGASTRLIAGRAGLPQGLIRHHFGSKEGLFRAVVDHGLRALRDAGQPSGQLAERVRPEGPARSALAVIVHALLEPGARRAWLVEERLQPLLRELDPRLEARLAQREPSAQRELLELACAWLAPLVCAPLLGGLPLDRPAAAAELARLPEPRLAPSAGLSRRAGPWAPAPAGRARR